MINITQIYNTFDGYRMCCGAETPRALKSIVAKSFQILSKLGNYKLYTDQFGAEFLKDIIPAECIVIFDFKIEYNDKLLYISKLQVQETLTSEYINFDMDYEASESLVLPEKADVYFDRYRPFSCTREYAELGMDLRFIDQIPCSNVIGFSDMKFQKEYLKEFRKWVEIASKQPKITRENAILSEEGTLRKLIVQQNKKVSTICQN